MFETLIRPHEVSQVPALTSIGEITEKLKEAEQKREEKRLRQIAHGRSKFGDAGSKRKRIGEVEQDDLDAVDPTDSKRVKTAYDGEAPMVSEVDLVSFGQEEPVATANASAPAEVSSKTPAKLSVSNVLPEVRGHTSYLTFACLLSTTSTKMSVEVPSEESSTLS